MACAAISAAPARATGAREGGADATAAPIATQGAGAARADAAAPNLPPDIVVTAGHRGEAKVAAESEFDEQAIASRGADSIQDLLTRLQPLIDPRGDPPLILINGRPAAFDRSILSYPPEALARLAVLKPEAGALYGAAGTRVVNLVLKQKFASMDIDGGASAATAGGQYGGNLGAMRVAISGDTRWNVQARISRTGALMASARAVTPPAGVFDAIGYVSAAGGGGAEIDPALSRAAGTFVSTAAIPAAARDGNVTLAAFVATANRTNPADPADFQTLLPSRRSMSFGAGVTRPFGDFSVSIGLDASSNGSDGLRGLPMATVVIPAGSRWSPFGADVLLTRPFDGTRALRSANDGQSLGASLTVGGMTGGWQGSFSANYAHSLSDSLLETGMDVARLQQLIDGGDAALNPYGALDGRLLTANRNRARTDSFSAALNVQRNIVKLPAGPLAWSFSANASRYTNVNVLSGSTAGAPDRAAGAQLDGQMSLNLPIARRGAAAGGIGDLMLGLTIGWQTMTGSPAQMRLSGNVTWSPLAALQLRGSIDRAETAPSFYLLNGPQITTINRVFDYARQEVADAAWITGGNPQLRRGSRESIALSMMARPPGTQALSLTMSYRQTISRDGPSGFPDLTPAVEAAFPGRVTRDAGGNLLSIDARPINIARDSDADLTSAIALNLGGAARAGRGDPAQFSLSLQHRWRLESAMLIRAGVPVIDRLGGGGGVSRHVVSLQIGAGRRAGGMNLGADWSSRARVSGQGADAFLITPPVMVNLSAFVAPERLFGAATRGLKVSLDVRNVLNGYRRVTLRDGSVPPGFSHDAVDPLGRTLQVAIRKRF